MNVRKLAVLAALATAAVLPAAAHATTPVDCTSLTARNTAGEPAAIRAGVCVQGQGYIEVGIGQGAQQGQLYVVASSDENGYVGVSSFESGDGDSQPCGPASPDGSEGGSGSNSGGCYGTNSFQVDLTALSGTVPLPVCGDDTGAWYSTSRNGCRADNEDVDETVVKALATAACIQANPADVVNCVLTYFP